MEKCLSRISRNQEGAVMVECALFLPLLAIMIMFLLVCYEIIDRQVELHIETYSALRSESIGLGTRAPFRLISVTKHAVIRVPGTLPKFIGKSVIPIESKMTSYAGPMGGSGQSTFRVPGYRQTMVSQ